MRRRHILLTAVVVAGALTPDVQAAWHAPVSGKLVQSFDYRRSRPFERGAHRGVRFAAVAGAPVHAVCSGTVTYAGSSIGGDVVTIRCGSLVATHLGLADVAVGSGTQVRAGKPIGRAGPGPVGLGARRDSDRWGYVDPMKLIAPRAPGLGPAPTRVRRQPPVEFRAPRPAFTHAPSARPAPPLVAWVGLALVAATLGGVTGVRSTVRRRWGPSTSPRRSTTSTPRPT